MGSAHTGMTQWLAHGYGVNPSVETIRLAHLQLFFVPLFFFEERVIGVDAVENCALCSFPSHLWARSVRPQGRQRPHRLPPWRNFQNVDARKTTSRNGSSKTGHTSVAAPSRKSLLGHPERLCFV